MQESKYLASGGKLGGHYEIVEVLGADDFEIVYLVKDKHLKDKLFILKELFLEGVSLRDTDQSLYSPAKSKYIFDETKKEVIAETQRLQSSNDKQPLETYGYFQENNTVYIIMEFSNDSKLEDYLQIQPEMEEEIERKEENPPVAKGEESKKSPVFLIGLIVSVLIFSALAYYAYKMIEEDKERAKKKPSNTTVEVLPHTPKPMNHPTLTTRDNRTKPVSKSSVVTDKNMSNSAKNETTQPKTRPTFSDDISYVPPTSKAYIEKNSTALKGVPKDELYMEDRGAVVSTEPTTFQPTPVPPTSKPVVREDEFNQKSINQFLIRFSDALSNASVNKILSFYDRDVQKYFKFTRVKHEDIRIDVEAYNKKWEYRDIRIGSFKVLRTYTEHGVEYCDLEARLKWSVSTSNFKSDLGVSIEWITLKLTPEGFKIKSIYLLK